MKTRKIFPLVALCFIAVLAVVSCQKSRYCLCITEETPINDTIIMNLDRGMSCKRIVQSGIQKMDSGMFKLDSIHTYTCTKIDKDSLRNYPGLHIQD